MTCCLCRKQRTTSTDATLCESCRFAELERLEISKHDREKALQLQQQRVEQLRGLAPSLFFVLKLMVEAGWSERAVSAARRSLTKPEQPIPAAFAYLRKAEQINRAV